MFDVLTKVKDKNNRPAIFTINSVVANPDFVKIKESNFLEYFYEPFTETLKRYPSHNNVLNLYKEGLKKGIIQVQFHGREHVHVLNWLNALQKKEAHALDAFEENMFTVFRGWPSNCNKEYLDAMATYDINQLRFLTLSIKKGVDLFRKIWGFQPLTLIPACYSWSREAEKVFYENGFLTIQSGRVQREPYNEHKKQNTKLHRKYMGQKSQHGLRYTIRNAIFEPKKNKTSDWVNITLREIANAFLWHKPAIICSHRANYIGYLNSDNRSHSLKLLKALLKEITTKWPDVEFMSSDELAKLMHRN